MVEVILLLVFLALSLWSAHDESFWLAVFALAILLAGAWLLGSIAMLGFLIDPITLAAFLVLSLAVGGPWALYKWSRHMNSDDIQNQLRSAKAKFDKEAATEGGDDTLIDGGFMESRYFPNDAKPSKNVNRIVYWIVLWPFSMVTYFFEDFLMDVGRWIYNRLGRIFVRITERAIPK